MLKLVGESAGSDVYKLLATHSPDLLVVDLDDDESILELLRPLPQQNLPAIIVVAPTASYALRAFEAGAIDYLVKPITQQRIQRAVERVAQEVRKRNAFPHNVSATATAQQPLVLKSGGRYVFLWPNEIQWIQAQRNNVSVHAENKRAYVSREGIGAIAQRLNDAQFIRIHRSFIVNVSEIRELQPCNNGEFILLLRDGKELPCSRGYRPNLEALWKNAETDAEQEKIIRRAAPQRRAA